jgi:hypothetical protein
MTDEQRISTVLQTIVDGKEYTLLERLEQYGPIPDMVTFRNFLLIAVVLIEKSKINESVATLMFKKIYTEHSGMGNHSERNYGDIILQYLNELSQSPYVNLSTVIGRMISTIIYDQAGNETTHIVRVTPRDRLLALNEALLEKYIGANPLDDHTMSLFYQCVQKINPQTFQITLSTRACLLMRQKILADGFNNYIGLFLRPYYTSMSSYWLPDAMYHVPEPFYEQIFITSADFMRELSRQSILGQITPVSEVLEFMTKYEFAKLNGRNVVDIRPLNLTPAWHRHARFVV